MGGGAAHQDRKPGGKVPGADASRRMTATAAANGYQQRPTAQVNVPLSGFPVSSRSRPLDGHARPGHGILLGREDKLAERVVNSLHQVKGTRIAHDAG